MTIEEKAIKTWGLTDNFMLASWMLKNGRLLNGSYQGYQRDVDHHEIGQFFKPSVRQEPGSSYIYIKKFMNRGNIRLGCTKYGHQIEFKKPLSQEQLDGLLDLLIEAELQELPIQFVRYNKNQEQIREDKSAFIRYILKHTKLYIDMDALLEFVYLD